MFKNIEKGSEEWEFQRLYWNFRKQNYTPEPDNDEYWDNLIAEADVVVNSFSGTEIAEYAKDVVMACVRDINRRNRCLNANSAGKNSN